MFPLALAGLPEFWYKELDPKSLTNQYQHRLPAILADHNFWEHSRSRQLLVLMEWCRGVSLQEEHDLSCGITVSRFSGEQIKEEKLLSTYFFSGICFLNTTQFKGHATAAGTRRCFKPLRVCLTEITKTIILFPQLQRWFLKGNYIAPWEVN